MTRKLTSFTCQYLTAGPSLGRALPLRSWEGALMSKAESPGRMPDPYKVLGPGNEPGGASNPPTKSL